MGTFSRFEEIEAWREARILAREIYQHTATPPLSADFALRDQLRRSALSVMSNIAEGFERDGNAEFQSFLSIAEASCGELRSQLFVALDAGYVGEADFIRLRDHEETVTRTVCALIAH